MKLPKLNLPPAENLQRWGQGLRDRAREDIHRFLHPTDPLSYRKRILAVSLAFVVLVAIVSWVAGANIQSPAEAAARTAPPTPSPILIPIESRVLTADVVTRGTARFGLPQSISLSPSALKPGSGIVTTLPEDGAQLNEGDVLMIASGRPVLVVQGEIPAYRDLVPGLSGEDVLQLEAALERLGFDPGRADGTYDERTSDAVADWYAKAGFDAFAPTPDQLAALHALEDEFAIATNEKLAAEDAAAAAPLAVEAARARAEYNVAASSGAARTAAQLAGQVEVQRALDAQKAAEREAERLTALVERLAAELETARLKTGVQVPIDEIVFIPVLPVRVEEPSVHIGDPAAGPVVTVTNNQLLIDSSLPLGEAPLVKPGMQVDIDEPELGIKATGIVSRVADTPGTDGVDGFHVYFETLVDETEMALEGFSLRLTIPVETTGDEVIVVPVSALSLAADGTSRIQVERDGRLGFVVVEPGLSADGFVQVTPVDGELRPGQFVVIGYE